MRRIILGLVLALAIAACNDDSSSPSEPSRQTVNLSGTWTGNVFVQGSAAQMVWTLSQTSDTSVSGPVRIGLSTGTVLLNGSLTGTLDGTILTYTISVGAGGIPLSPTCVGQLGGTMTATLTVPSTLAGDFIVRSSTCPAPLANGTITLTRS